MTWKYSESASELLMESIREQILVMIRTSGHTTLPSMGNDNANTITEGQKKLSEASLKGSTKYASRTYIMLPVKIVTFCNIFFSA